MKPKVIYLDGGPSNGKIAYVYKHVKEFYIRATTKRVKHLYKEDQKVKGLFVYTGIVS